MAEVIMVVFSGYISVAKCENFHHRLTEMIRVSMGGPVRFRDLVHHSPMARRRCLGALYG